jgi:endoglucanase
MKWSNTLVYFFLIYLAPGNHCEAQTVVRYNQLGYIPADIKVAVTASKDAQFRLNHYQLKNVKTGQVAINALHPSEKDYGAYGPFRHSFRINFSSVTQPGEYRLVVNDSILSEIIYIDHNVYKGSADACLRFLRGQRCGINPVPTDSCHHGKDYSLGATIDDSTIMDVSGGWHNAGNYRQETITAAIATWYLLSAYQHFPALFNDNFNTNGKAGKNDKPDVLDEAKWGLDWLIKMHPSKDRLYRQVDDSASKIDRPVYSVRYNNQARINETVAIAAMASSAFSLGSMLVNKADATYADRLSERAVNAYQWATQYASSGGSNTMQLAAGQLYQLKNDKRYLADFNGLSVKQQSAANGKEDNTLFRFIDYVTNDPSFSQDCSLLKGVIEKVKANAKNNAFMRGIPFVPGSNNLTVSFADQCGNYRNSCNDASFAELEQANIDWLFGCNPWGVIMVSGFGGVSVSNPYGMHPARGYVPALVSGPVNAAAYKASSGTSLFKKDAYAAWQSEMAVYHDDAADNATNEPTIAGTAALIYLLASKESEALRNTPNGLEIKDGAVIRGDSAQKKVAIVFLGSRNGNGATAIRQILAKEKLHASFFVSSDYAKRNAALVKQLRAGGHYIGASGNPVCDQPGCDNAISKDAVTAGILENYDALKPFGITLKNAPVLLPFTEKYNADLSTWANYYALTLINHTPGTLSMADNILPGMRGYAGSDIIFQTIMSKARQMPYGINGYFLVLHTDADPLRTDKFYMLLPLLLQELKAEGYQFLRVDEILGLKVPVVKKAPSKKAGSISKKRRRK